MDPNKVLQQIRERLRDLDGQTRDDLYFLAEDFFALDNWLMCGGFLPKDWIVGDPFARKGKD